MRTMLCTAALFAAAVLFWSPPSRAADPSGSSSDAVQNLVRQALQAELAGGDRDELLLQALALDPNCQEARWQLGYVRLGDEWVKVDDVPAHVADDGQLSAYRQKRDGLVDTADNHRALARWCRKHNLPAEARLHWMKLLEYEQQDAEALAALGLKWHAGRLMTQKQIDQERAQAGERMAVLRRYRPQMIKYRAVVLGNNEKKADEVLAALQQIDDPSVLPAMESVFAVDAASDGNDRLNQLLIEAAARMNHPEATDVLLRRALDADSVEVRLAACEALKKRPMFTYLPQLIAAMPGETTTRFSIYMLPGGTVVHEHEVAFEDSQGKHTATYESSVTPSDLGVAQIVTPRALASEARKAQAIERQAAIQEALLQQRRERVQLALMRTTGFENPEDPDLWAKQYAEYYGWRTSEESKPETSTHVEQYAAYYLIAAPTSENTAPESRPAAPPPRNISNLRQRATHMYCFAAGTPVLTIDGPRPIESIRLGDRVLSQDLATGELAYKTVQQRTLRPPVKLIRLHLDDQSLVSTFGHPYWVVGHGWQVAGYLQPGMRLRGLERDVTVEKIEEVPSREVYNLLVSDFATYFAGDQRLLVHDDSPLEVSSAVVPGLAAQAVNP